jgi:hypothetical protein
MEEPNLISDAANIREIYLRRSFPKGNIAIIEVRLEDGKAFGMGATSRANSPAPHQNLSQREDNLNLL